MDRIIVLVDMDCFYVQVEQRANPTLKGKPCAVVQYNTWKGGGIIAVGYEARAKGVTRQMRGNDAKAKCPEIILVRVPEVRGKADLTKYREAGAEVIEVFSKFSNCVERASIDEAYVDLTEEVKKRMDDMGTGRVTEDKLANTHAVGFEVKTEDKEKAVIRLEGVCNWLHSIYEDEEVSDADKQLAIGATIVEEMRAAVYEETGFRCSAGIAHNKVLAKLACGVNKPNKQTVLPHNSVTSFFMTMPISKVRGFGGKFGDAVKETLQVEYMAELQQFSQRKLQDCFGAKSGSWVHDICRGFEYEAVSARQLAKSVGCSKNFRGREKLDTREKVKKWLFSLAKEVVERLEKDKEQNKRKAKSLIVGLSQDFGKSSTYSSRTCAIVKYDAQKFADDAFVLLSKFNKASTNQIFWDPPLLNLSMSASKFADISSEGSASITSFMTQNATTPSQFARSELSIDSQRPKQTPKPKGIQLFLSQSQSVPKKSELWESQLDFDNTQTQIDNVRSVSNTAEVAPTKDSSDQIGDETPKRSFFKNYLQKKKEPSSVKGNGASDSIDSSSCDRNISKSDAPSTHKLDSVVPNFAIDENSLDDFNVGSSVHKTSSHCGVDQHSDSAYAADTDYSDESNECVVGNAGLQNERTENPNEFDAEMDVVASTSDNVSSAVQTMESTNSSEMSELQGANCQDTGAVSLNNEDMMTCDDCGQSVLIWEFPEHADFHFAMKLHQETKKEQKPLTLDDLPASKRKDLTPPNRGRKKAKLNSGNMKTLDTFFKS